MAGRKFDLGPRRRLGPRCSAVLAPRSEARPMFEVPTRFVGPGRLAEGLGGLGVSGTTWRPVFPPPLLKVMSRAGSPDAPNLFDRSSVDVRGRVVHELPLLLGAVVDHAPVLRDPHVAPEPVLLVDACLVAGPECPTGRTETTKEWARNPWGAASPTHMTGWGGGIPLRDSPRRAKTLGPNASLALRRYGPEDTVPSTPPCSAKWEHDESSEPQANSLCSNRGPPYRLRQLDAAHRMAATHGCGLAAADGISASFGSTASMLAAAVHLSADTHGVGAAHRIAAAHRVATAPGTAATIWIAATHATPVFHGLVRFPARRCQRNLRGHPNPMWPLLPTTKNPCPTGRRDGSGG